MVERFNPAMLFSTQRPATMHCEPGGEYVKYEDYAALRAQLEKAREALGLAEKDIVYAFDALGIPEDKSSVLPVVRNAMSQEGE